MAFRKKKAKAVNAAAEEAQMSQGEIDDLKNWSEADFEDPKKIRKHLKKRQKKRKYKDPIVRVEDIERALKEHGEDIDPETVISTYLPRRRARRLGNALLHMDKVFWGILAAFAIIVIIYILAFSQERMGNFTINLNRLELYRRGISIASDGEFTDPTARLSASSLQDATNTTWEDLPDDLDEVDGDHNGRNYVAYTYYVRNAGKETLKYKATVNLENSSKGAEKAARIAVYQNGDLTTYAAPGKDGKPEVGCENFIDDELVCEYDVDGFEVGYVDKYTVVIWLEGNDPDCVDRIVGGSMRFTMNIDAIEESNTSLFTKLAQDIKDTFTGNKGIWAAGENAPDYYNDGKITWDTRRNKTKDPAKVTE
ncbi:MAG: hypothetical protein Q4B73_01280 [Lachnospiraceae bacterium]|nr:hypothetical protein [Lachnospiraceae bacterium]